MSDISRGTVYVTAESVAQPWRSAHQKGRRGVNIYTLSDLLSVSGEARGGEIISGTIQQNLFTLSLDERVQVYRKCDPVFGLVTGRAKRIAGLKWAVKKVTKDDDRIEAHVKMATELFREWSEPTIKGQVIRARCLKYVLGILPDARPDFSNIGSALARWKRRNKMAYDDRSQEIMDWLHEPNAEDNFNQFVQKTVIDLMVHGGVGWYKERMNRLIENVYVLPGGTVLPFRSTFVGGGSAYVQILNGIPPKVYFPDEITYIAYAPNSMLSYGAVPLEALVNKVAEYLMFDEQAAQKADGTSAPEKLIVMNDQFPFGDEDLGKDLPVPLTREEQSKIETLMNEPRRNAIRVLTGYGGQGQPTVVDLSRESTFQSQSERQDKILRAVAIVYNVSNVEINLTGSEDTSGRATSESQQDSDQQKGWAPIAMQFEDAINTDILPQKFGHGYALESEKGLNDKQKVDLLRARLETGAYSVNEVRTGAGEEPYPEPEYDRPKSPSAADGSALNPLSMRSVG